jgi:hypothetical protein
MTMRRLRLNVAGVLLPAAAVALLAPALVGCGSGASDTGYEPNRLGMSDASRRALYAPKYSPEQAQAQASREAEMRRRPGGGLTPGAGSGGY